MEVASKEVLEDYVFSCLANKTDWVILESHDMGIVNALVAYVAQKKEFREQLVPENFRIFITGPKLPRVIVIKKALIPKIVIATFLSVAGDEEHAKVIRESNDEQDIIIFADTSDRIIPMMAMGMAARFEQWKREKKDL
jgi:hypothetical protein